MKTEQEKYQLIDQFLKGELPDQHEFFNQFAKDESLKDEVNIQRLLKNAVVDYQLMNVKAELNLFHKEKVSGNLRKRWVSTSLLGLIAGGALLYFFTTNTFQKENIEAKKGILTAVKANPKTDISFSPIKSDIDISKSKDESTPKTLKVERSEISEKYVEPVIQNYGRKSYLKPDTISSPVSNPSIDVISQEKQNSPIKKSEIKTRMETAMFGDKEPKIEPEAKPKHEIKNYVFEPNNETWEVPIDSDKSGNLSIFDRNGKMMYRREFNKMERLVWEGNSSDGATLPPSVYVFMIEYSDGSSHQGTITISY